ncbi:Trm112 family protein [candidate division KSB1 bacterium]
MLNQELLEMLACPKCKSIEKTESGEEKQHDLEYDKENNYLICHLCKLKYRIEDDIPIMLIDEAEAL